MLILEFPGNYQESPLEVTLLPHTMDGEFRSFVALKKDYEIPVWGIEVLRKFNSKLEINNVFPMSKCTVLPEF